MSYITIPELPPPNTYQLQERHMFEMFAKMLKYVSINETCGASDLQEKTSEEHTFSWIVPITILGVLSPTASIQQGTNPCSTATEYYQLVGASYRESQAPF